MATKIDFDLFLLHRKEDNKDPRCWILASGKNLRKEVTQLIKEIDYKNYEIVNLIANKLKYGIKLSGNPSNFGNEIKEKLRKSKFAKTKIASLTRTSGGHWNKIEESKHFPSCAKLQKIQKYLGKSSLLNVSCQKNDFCLKSLTLIWNSLSAEDVPLVMLKELLKIWKDKLRISENNFSKRKKRILNSIEFLRAYQHRSTLVKAQLTLNKDLAKIIGAFCADGNFWPPDMIRWEEGYEDNVEALSTWLAKCFGLKTKVKKSKREKKSWTLRFRSKVIARYLETYFGFKPECKVYSVRAPKIIRFAPKHIQKAFVTGAMTFDGSANSDGTIGFGVKSKAFRDDVAAIVGQECEISAPKYADVRGLWYFSSKRSLSKNQKRKLLFCFETQTTKWQKFKELIVGFQKSVNSIEDAKTILNQRYFYINKPTLAEVLDYVKRVKMFDVYAFLLELNIKRKSAADRLALLEKANILSSNVKHRRKLYIYNPNIVEWRLPSLKGS